MIDVIGAYKKTAANLLKDPDSAEDLSNQFTLLDARGKRSPAQLMLARRCAAVAPDKFIAVFNLGSAELKAGFYHESIATFERALKLADKDQEAITLRHIGLAWYTAGNTEEALSWYAKCPDDTELRQSIAIARLQGGDLTGLYDFECEYHTPRRKPIAEAGIPRWKGENLTGKTVIIAHEQGNGDTIQFSRFIPQVKAKRVIWSGPDALHDLMADNFKFDEMVGEEGPFKADYYCSPISICGALKIPYSAVDGSAYIKAAPMFLPARGKLKIGLCWAGNADYAHDAERSIALEQLMPLLELPGTAFYSFQVGRGESDITNLGLDGLIANLGGTFKAWRDTARAAAAMDLMVSVDSGAAHISGALGKPTLILLPYANCWRWCLDSTTTPWYGSATLFRQPAPGQWAEPIYWVKREIEGMLNGREQGRRALSA